MEANITVTCRAVLFDMDGTLVDSTRAVERAWGWWAKRHGIPLETVLAFSHGRPGIVTMEHFLPGRDHTAELQEMTLYEEAQVDGILAVPGATEVIDAIQGHPWAIVTSAWRTLAQSRVTTAGMPLPEVLIPVDEIRNGKPHPEGYLRAAERLQVDPKDCLVFEDTRPGIEAALNAGMQAVGLLTTVCAQALAHSPLIRDFRDVKFRPSPDSLWVDLCSVG